MSGLCLSCTALLPQDDDEDDQDYKRAAISRRERGRRGGHNEEMNRLEGNERWRRRGAVLNMAILSNAPTESCGH